MTTARLTSVGFCAHYSPEGDWAFDYALRLSRLRSLQLNVFHFLHDPYETKDFAPSPVGPELERLAIDKERELRMYYDRRAGDFLDIGFRLCHDDGWRELHRCLAIHEFQMLVLGYPRYGATFAGKSIEAFAESFVCPVILVGPEGPDRFRLNRQAALEVDRLGLESEEWLATALASGPPRE